ncbi:hypothetical protein [Streptomyces fradiae]|uniref:hypothetical protein n=1 Tax=Streptomyces fradiae TaxID=1906 RepID=UPI003516A163
MSVRNQPSKSSPFQLRWKGGPEVHRLVFANKTPADGHRSRLMSAQHKGKRFNTEIGLPASELRTLDSPLVRARLRVRPDELSQCCGKHRVGIAGNLTNITPALTTSQKGAPEARTLRLSLRN